jgi:hypothetical protein
MHVAAFCSPSDPDWRWRIVGYDGEMVEESHQTFPTITAAVAHGAQRLVEMNAVNRTELDRTYRWSSQQRRRR